MDADKTFIFNLRLSVFIGGWNFVFISGDGRRQAL